MDMWKILRDCELEKMDNLGRIIEREGMRYKLIRKRYLTVIDDLPFNREFREDSMFEKLGANKTHIVLSQDNTLLFVSKRTLQDDFISNWGGRNETETD